MLVLIDNYDSFVHNLARYCEELGCETKVVRNDCMSADGIAELGPRAIIISPGPCTPNEAGVSQEVVQRFSETTPILGVCLGHQAIASSAGARIIRSPRPVHGQTSPIEHDGSQLFHGLPNPLRVMRYHALIIDEVTLSSTYRVTARTGAIPMAIEHRSRPVFGVQFHPESVLTECGRFLLGNFLRIAGFDVSPSGESELTAPVDQSLWTQKFEVGHSTI